MVSDLFKNSALGIAKSKELCREAFLGHFELCSVVTPN